tara:strand:+ start:71 stop:211 length:141 start_codon:yes stop_codon:yes gene_type:complete
MILDLRPLCIWDLQFDTFGDYVFEQEVPLDTALIHCAVAKGRAGFY